MARPEPRRSGIALRRTGDRSDLSDSLRCPLLAGAALIHGGSLHGRTRGGIATVRAPKRFLKALFDWCDGSHSIDALGELARARWGESEFIPFVRAMLASGVLIEATEHLGAAFDAVQLPSALGVVAAPAEWDARRRRADAPLPGSARSTMLPTGTRLALDTLTAERRSAAAFDDKRISAGALSALLRAIYGVVGERGDAAETSLARRTTPSAGAFNSLRFSLVLIRRVGRVAAGVYEIVFEAEGRVALRRLGELPHDWCRALLDAHRWLAATGLIVASADTAAAALKYRNRALQFALLEAGAALQNGGLAAAELGLDFRWLGGYYAERVDRLCNLNAERVLCCAVFGASRDEVSRASLPARRQLRFRWSDDGSMGDLAIARAEVSSTPLPGPGWGRSADAQTACSIAVAEAVERYSFATLGHCVEARMRDLGSAVPIPIESLANYAASQFTDPQLRIVPFDADRGYLWVQFNHWHSRRNTWIPAEFVYAARALPERFREQALTRATSSGCATDAKRDTAIRRAAFEIIERDAFARHWLLQRPGSAIRPSSLPVAFAARVDRLEEESCHASVHVLDGGLGPVLLVAIESQGFGFSAVGAACGDDALASLARAFSEAETAATIRQRSGPVPGMKSTDIRKPGDHMELYAQKRHFRRARALTAGTEHESWQTLERRWPRTLEARLHTRGRRTTLLWADISAADAPLDPYGRSLATVRAIIPGCVPIAFGADAIPRGGFGRVSAAARFPHPLS